MYLGKHGEEVRGGGITLYSIVQNMYVKRVMEVGRGVKGLRRTRMKEGMETDKRRGGCSNTNAGGGEMEEERWRKIHM